MKFKKNNNFFLKNIRKNFLYLILFFLIVAHFSFFQNVFRIIKYEKDQRLLNNSNFCEKDSQGYIIYLKKNYTFISNPKLYNNEIAPLADWIYYDFKKDNEIKEIILLNYDEFQTINTSLKSGKFFLNEVPAMMKNIFSIKMIFDYELKKNHEGELKIYRIENEKQKIIFSEKILLKKNEKIFEKGLSLDESNRSKLTKYIITLENFDNKIIEKLIIKIQNKIDLKKFEIIDQKQNCYLLKKL